LSGTIADEEPKPCRTFAEVHDEVAVLLCRPGAVRVSGHARDVQVAIADLEHEQDVEPPQCHRAVDAWKKSIASMRRNCRQLVSVWSVPDFIDTHLGCQVG
jgi:hypothetical protein